MNALRDSDAIGGHDIQFEGVLIDLREQGGSGNGERKRGGRRARTRDRAFPFAHGHQFRLHLQAMHCRAYLFIGGKLDFCPHFRRQALRHLVHLGMLLDGSHRQARGEQIQPTDTLLESRVHRRRTMIATIRHTGDLAELSGSPNQPSQGRTRDA